MRTVHKMTAIQISGYFSIVDKQVERKFDLKPVILAHLNPLIWIIYQLKRQAYWRTFTSSSSANLLLWWRKKGFLKKGEMNPFKDLQHII